MGFVVEPGKVSVVQVPAYSAEAAVCACSTGLHNNHASDIHAHTTHT